MDRRIVLLMAALLIAPCSAELITVDDNGPADYQTIQEAINSSVDGDTIVVRPGTYREQVGFSGRRVTVRSEDPDNPAVVEATVITSDSGSSVFFDFGEGSGSVLEGFTITGRGVKCVGTSPTISRNVIRDCAGAGITGESNAAPTIVGNTITGNQREGIHECDGLIRDNTLMQNRIGIAYCNGPIQGNVVSDHELEGVYSCDGPIERNTIVRNSAGVAYADGLIRDNHIAENGDAGGLYFCNAEIVGNTIINNTASSDGGGLYGCNGTIRNNVIAGNRTEDNGGALYDCRGLICNNTIVGNLAVVRGGALADCPTPVCNNIIAYNRATVTGGISGTATNSYNAFWANAGGNLGRGATAGAGDVVMDPLFAANGEWDDGGAATVEDDVWTQGDYHLLSQAGRWDPEDRQWVVDEVTSTSVDTGDPATSWVEELWPHGRRVNKGAYGGTPEASWSLSEAGHPSDLNQDGQIDTLDLERLAGAWLVEEDLQVEDIDRNGVEDFVDFAIVAQAWRMGPPPATPPTPNPMTFATAPYGTGPYSMAMVATTAVSTDGTGIEYYFEDASDPTVNSDWLVFTAGQEPRWEVTDLLANKRYGYRVKARNRGNLLETDWSERLYGWTEQADFTAPTPDPMTWETEPYGSGPDTIRMVATIAVDPSGVEYKFDCTSHPQFSSGWQDSHTYEVTSVPQGRYAFTVRARDKSAAQNMTTQSAPVIVDLTPPTPNPMEWEVEPREINIGGGAFTYHATMTAAEATDDVDDVEYYFQCTTESGFSSGWQTSREYTVLVGRSGQRHRFRVKARDTSSSHNETDWSPVVAAQ